MLARKGLADLSNCQAADRQQVSPGCLNWQHDFLQFFSVAMANRRARVRRDGNERKEGMYSRCLGAAVLVVPAGSGTDTQIALVASLRR